MSEPEPQFDYPVKLKGHHVVYEPIGYEGGQFKCHPSDAHTHTGAWPTWDYCPYCGGEL